MRVLVATRLVDFRKGMGGLAALVKDGLLKDPYSGVVYAYAPDRKAERVVGHLAGFKGVLQVDGYAGYRPLAEKGDVRLAFCWAHVRGASRICPLPGRRRSPARPRGRLTTPHFRTSPRAASISPDRARADIRGC